VVFCLDLSSYRATLDWAISCALVEVEAINARCIGRNHLYSDPLVDYSHSKV